MSKIEQAIGVLHEVDNEANERGKNNVLHPTARLMTTIIFILTVISFRKYEIVGLLGMSLYILATGIIEEISISKGIGRVKYILLLVVLLGIVNPFFDKTEMFLVGNVVITGGMISMLTLMLKGILTVMSVYLLLMCTGIWQICRAMRSIGIPKGGVTVILLIYRYIIVLLKEVQRMNTAYHMRAPGQKGIHIKAWGSFVGLLLLRSMDRAECVYDSMELRGYNGEYFYHLSSEKNRESVGLSILYVIFWAILFLLLRFVPVFDWIGNLFI